MIHAVVLSKSPNQKICDLHNMMAFKSCSQQTEESYQLQLALALRLSSQAALVNDPNFLESKSVDSSLSTSPQALSYRFWVSGSLSYFDTIPDGFYVIHGLDPYVWTISTERGTGRLPSLESLHAIDIHDGLSVKVILVNRFGDPGLKGLLDRVALLFGDWIATEDVIDQLANIVCAHLGGIATAEDEAFVQHWKDCSEVTTSHLGSIVLPIGSISVGLCVHRALLFKVLADSINLPCRIVKGCKYCGKDAASSCLVQTENAKEYLVDLFAKPGALAHPDSSLNYAPSRVVSSPLSYPRFKPIHTREDIKMLAKLYFLDFQNLNFSYDDTGADIDGNQEYKIGSSANKSKKNAVPIISKKHNFTISSPQRVAQNAILKKDILVAGSSSALVDINNRHLNEGLMPQNFIISTGQRDAHPSPGTSNNLPFVRTEQSVSSQLHLEEEDLDILWTELVLKEKIGAGSFGTVHRAEWRGTEVAVKILLEQDFAAEHIKKFLSEIAIMRRLRHPNIVLFMGAVTQPPNLSIVTEYLSRGSLHKLLHKSNDGYHLDKRRRLNMAYDVAKGMSYLHQLRPPIVHRDLKSPNLLVDSTYTVKVCDFGLSRVKANTYLSSKTNNPGTPEWMAPEVLRNELSNEKSDVYSFGVILWELVTLQQPWRNLSRAQVVAAVGFMGQRLEIPSNVNPSLGVLIDICLANDPKDRPPFTYIVETLQKLIENSTSIYL